MSYIVGKSKNKKEDKLEEIQMPESSFLASVEYDAANFSMTINFKSGLSVIHKFVYPMVFEQMKQSPSKGSFYANNIKRQYPSVELQSGLKVSDFNRAVKEFRIAKRHS